MTVKPISETRFWTIVTALVCLATFAMSLIVHTVFADMPALPQRDLVVYEDGSGVEHLPNGQEVVYDSGTFVWDCATMGNSVCGDIDDAHISN